MLEGDGELPLLSKQIEKRIEDELRNYKDNVKQYAERKEEIYHGSSRPHSSEGRAIGHVSDPTLARATKLAMLAESEDAKWLLVVHDALNWLPKELQLLIRYRYFEGYSPDIVADKLHVGRTLFFAWRENMLMQLAFIATQRGLIKHFNM